MSTPLLGRHPPGANCRACGGVSIAKGDADPEDEDDGQQATRQASKERRTGRYRRGGQAGSRPPARTASTRFEGTVSVGGDETSSAAGPAGMAPEGASESIDLSKNTTRSPGKRSSQSKLPSEGADLPTANVPGAEADRRRASTKRAVLIGMLERPEGASVAELGLAAAHGARRHHRSAPHRSRGDSKQGCRGPVCVSARSGRNCARPVTAMAAQQKDVTREALLRLPTLDIYALREEWRFLYKTDASPHLSRELLIRAVAYRIQEVALGGLRPEPLRQLRQIAQELKQTGTVARRFRPQLKPGTRLMREWQGRTYEVVVLDDGCSWQGAQYRSLSAIARKITGTAWSGPLFFGLKRNRSASRRSSPSSLPVCGLTESSHGAT
jgi:hypothetical protein